MEIESVSVSKSNVIGIYKIKGIVQGSWVYAYTDDEKIYDNLYDENHEYNEKELEYCHKKLTDAYKRKWC